MKDWYIYYLAEARRREYEIERAEKYRMAKNDPFKPAIPSKSRFHQRLFMALGTRMVNWGYRLQARYGELNIPSLRDYASEPPTNPC